MDARTSPASRMLADRDAMAADVREGLTRSPQKSLPPKYFYDPIGSALFEIITLLPEYGLTRAEERLLRAHGGEMLARLDAVELIAELGSGSGRKTRHVLDAATRRRQVRYRPIEISESALAQCARELGDIPGLRIDGVALDYLDGLHVITAQRRASAPMLVLFLGSTIGNFEHAAAHRFLAYIRRLLRPGDALLLGADLDKPVDRVLAAYDDPLGVTAAFNLNQLARINRELGAVFDLRRFRHEARFDAGARAVEMHLRSLAPQSVRIPGAGLDLSLREGETIFTEISRKFLVDEVAAMGTQSGFHCAGQWLDREWAFADTLLVAG